MTHLQETKLNIAITYIANGMNDGTGREYKVADVKRLAMQYTGYSAEIINRAWLALMADGMIVITKHNPSLMAKRVA